MRVFGIVNAMVRIRGIEVAAGRFEIGCVALSDRMDMDPMVCLAAIAPLSLQSSLRRR